jgi:hypothetical protein
MMSFVLANWSKVKNSLNLVVSGKSCHHLFTIVPALERDAVKVMRRSWHLMIRILIIVSPPWIGA